MKRTISIISTACLLSISVHSQEVLTLEKCRELAIKNNAKAVNSQLSLEAAGESKREAFTNYFPSVSAVGLGFRASDPMVEMSTEYGPVGMLEKGIIGAVTASQPVFAGGQIVNGNKLARLGVEAAALQKAMSDDEVLLAVEQYYWQIVTLEEKTKTIAEAERLLDRIHTDVKNSLEAGLVNRNDLLKVELKQNELESGKLKLANGLQLSKMVLAQFIGLPSGNFDIDRSLIENVTLLFDTRIDHLSALRGRAEYRLLEKNIEANKLQVKMEMGKRLPTIAVGAGWNYINFDKGSPLASTKDFGMVFATVSVPVSGWWGGSHAIRKQKLQVMMAENDKRNAEELLLIQMRQLSNDVEEAAQQVQLADKAIASALDNVRLNADYYGAGTGLLSDLLDAQSALQQVRDQRTEAVALFCVKLAKYRQATRT